MSAQCWIVNGMKNSLSFGTDASPGYGKLGGGAVYSSHDAAEGQLGVGQAIPLKFNSQNQQQQYPTGPTATFSWGCTAVYFSRNGNLMALFAGTFSSIMANAYATKLGAGYVTHACTLSTT
jgi:hypothetical protein